MTKLKNKTKTVDKKNIKDLALAEEIVEDIEEFDDEEFEFIEEDEVEEIKESKKEKVSKLIEDDDDDEIIELSLEERVISIEKKQNITLVLLVIITILSLIIFISGLGGNSYSDSEEADTSTETQNQSTSYDTSAFTKIKAQDIESLSKKGSIIVWIGRQGCGYCTQYVPVITAVGEALNETIYYIDLSDIFDFSTSPVTILDEEAYDLLSNIATDKDNEDVMTEFGATPMTLVIKKNKVVGSFVGAYDEENVISLLEAEGFKQK